MNDSTLASDLPGSRAPTSGAPASGAPASDAPASGAPASRALLSHLRAHRAEAGLSQAELARRAGVSRQAVGAIEAGRQVPSTALALHLARALECTVEDLFGLTDTPVVRARMAGRSEPATRVVVGRPGGVLVAHPLTDEGSSADGVVRDPVGSREAVRVELFGDPTDIEANVLVAGCAPLIGLLADRLERRYRGGRASWIPANSSRALDLLGRGLVHIAGIHLADGTDPSAHARAAGRALGGREAVLINLARWRQGLVVAAGNPLGLRGAGDLLRPGLRWAMREPESGAARLLHRVLGAVAGGAAESLIRGVRARDHGEVARLVRWGLADVGVAIESAALAEGLGFVALAEERFDLVLPRAALDEPPVSRLVELIDAPDFRSEASGLPGYDLSLCGDIEMIAPTTR